MTLTGSSSLIRRLTAEDASLFVPFRRAALRESPFAFSSSVEDDRARSMDFVREAIAGRDQAVFGAFAPQLVGAVGIYRDPSAKGAHKASLWGLYVVPGARSTGLGRALVVAALDFAASLEGVTHVYVSATERAPEAMALYASLGFITWGVEPAALRVGDIAVSESHMVRTLAGDSA